MEKKMTPETIWEKYQSGVRFNNGINFYKTVETNENFFIGRQWEGVQANGLPTPTFNFLKRVVLFSVASVSTDNLKLHASPMAGESLPDYMPEIVTDIINRQFEAIFENNNMGKLIREYCRNSAVDADGATFTYWDDATNSIKTEVIDNAQVYFGNPNDRDEQNQPYIVIERRMLPDDAKRLMAKYGGGDTEAIQSDRRSYQKAGDFDAKGGDKVTVLLTMWRDDETGTVWACESTQNTMIRQPWDLGIKRYPITWMNWDYMQDCYHGQAMITGLIPNQIFVNKLYAMSGISLMMLAFPKIMFDRTRIKKWDNRVGGAIAVTGNIADAAKIMNPAQVSPQISQFIDSAISYTQKFLGASDVALGDTRPDNTSAIIALQRAASTPMELTKQNLLQSIENWGRICLDFMAAYYGKRPVEVRNPQTKEMDTILFDFSMLQKIAMSIKLDVGASSYWSEIANMQTLDNLLMQNKIGVVEYLERVPSGMITNKEALIEKMKQNEAAQSAAMSAVASAPPPDASGADSPGGTNKKGGFVQ